MADEQKNDQPAPEGQNDALTKGEGVIPTLTKMSVKTLKCKPAKAGTNADNRRILLCRIRGNATGIKSAIGNDGTTVYGLTGFFEGVNAESGEKFQSGVCFLPGGIQELILEPLDKALNDAAAAAPSIIFAFDIFAEPATNKAGYGYSAVNLIPATGANPLAALDEAMASAKIAALPAPKKAA